MDNFDRSVINLLSSKVFNVDPQLKTNLENCKTYEEIYHFLQATRCNLDKKLGEIPSSSETRELVEELHKYNMFKDMAQEMIGSLAHLQGTTVKEIHEKWKLPRD